MIFFKQIADIASYLKVEDSNNAFEEMRRILDDVWQKCNRGMLLWSPIPLLGRVLAGLNGPLSTKQQSDHTATKGEREIERVTHVNRIQFSALLPPQKKQRWRLSKDKAGGWGFLLVMGLTLSWG